jgi:HK97 family phage major capsid protein
MPNNIVNREKAEALIREQVVPAIFQDAPKSSTVLSLGKKLPNMTSKQTRIRVTDLLPMAYWVNGDTGMKQTSRMAWDNVWLTAGELAVIVPIPEAVLDDAEFDLIGEIKPRIAEAIAQKVDSAVIFGDDRPMEWPNDVITMARQAGNNVAPGSNDMFDLIMAEGGVLNKIEEDGYISSGALASTGMKAKLRGLKGTDGHPIFSTSMQGATVYGLDGAPLYFPDNGSFNPAVAQLVVGDFSKMVYSIRQDITVKLLTESVIQDPATKEIIFNLAQQDMIAIRVVFRMGWAMPNPATRLDMDRTGCPFAYLEPATPVTTRKVTFTVKTGSAETDTAEGAVVEVNGSRIKTGADGTAVFNLRPGTYPVKVKLEGYLTQSDTLKVAGSAVTKTITLVKA